MPTFDMDRRNLDPYDYDGPNKSPIDMLIDAAGGKALPGRWGLAQALVNTWSAERTGNTYIHYAKLGLNTLGIIRAYKNHRDNPGTNVSSAYEVIEAYIKKNNLSIPRELEFLRSFIYVYSKEWGKFEDFFPGEVEQNKQELFVRKFKLDDIDYFYVGSKSNYLGVADWESFLVGPYIKEDRKKDFVKNINKVIWEVEKNSDLQLTAKNSNDKRAFALTNIGTPDDYVSEGATEWADVQEIGKRCKAFMDKGLSRKILFYGPPGTGKTTLARTLVTGKTLRIESAAIELAGTRAVMDFVMLLRPKVILFDDLDRNESYAVEILHYMEGIGNKDSIYSEIWEDGFLVVGTVNTLSTIDPALLRPGRFDEVHRIGEPAEAHRKNIINHYLEKFELDSKDIKKAFKLKEEPIGWLAEQTNLFSPADIKEVLQSVAVVGLEYLLDEIKRVRLQRELYDGDACEDFLVKSAAKAQVVPAGRRPRRK